MFGELSQESLARQRYKIPGNELKIKIVEKNEKDNENLWKSQKNFQTSMNRVMNE